MGTIIGWVLLLGPLLKSLLTKLVPWVARKFGGGLKTITGAGGTVLAGEAIGSTVTKVGVLGAILSVISRIWAWLGRFPTWLKGIFATGGALGFLKPFFEFLVHFAKTPVLLFLSLVVSAFFPTIVEKIFLVVGALALKIFLFIFKLGKKAFIGAVGQEGGAVDEFRQWVLGSFDELPQPMIDIMGYLHLVEDLGMIFTTVALLAVVSAFRVVYGGVFVKSGSPLV